MKEKTKIIPVLIISSLLSIKWLEYAKSVEEMANSRWHTFMAATYFSRKNEDLALKELEEAIKTKVVYPEAYVKIGIYYLNKGLYEEAIKLLLHAFQFYPSDREICLSISRSLEGMENLNDAIRWAEYCFNLKQEKNTLIFLASLYIKVERTKEAYNLLIKFKNTDDPDILLLLGISAFKTGKKEFAIRIFETLLSLPEIPESVKTLIKKEIEK